MSVDVNRALDAMRERVGPTEWVELESGEFTYLFLRDAEGRYRIRKLKDDGTTFVLEYDTWLYGQGAPWCSCPGQTRARYIENCKHIDWVAILEAGELPEGARWIKL